MEYTTNREALLKVKYYEIIQYCVLLSRSSIVLINCMFFINNYQGLYDDVTYCVNTCLQYSVSMRYTTL